jgi:hypothetical protein
LHGYAERQGRQFQSYRFSLPSALLAEDKRMFRISARKCFFAAANKNVLHRGAKIE